MEKFLFIALKVYLDQLQFAWHILYSQKKCHLIELFKWYICKSKIKSKRNVSNPNIGFTI